MKAVFNLQKFEGRGQSWVFSKLDNFRLFPLYEQSKEEIDFEKSYWPFLRSILTDILESLWKPELVDYYYNLTFSLILRESWFKWISYSWGSWYMQLTSDPMMDINPFYEKWKGKNKVKWRFRIFSKYFAGLSDDTLKMIKNRKNSKWGEIWDRLIIEKLVKIANGEPKEKNKINTDNFIRAAKRNKHLNISIWIIYKLWIGDDRWEKYYSRHKDRFIAEMKTPTPLRKKDWTIIKEFNWVTRDSVNVLLSEKGVKTFSNNDEFKDFLAKVNSNKDMMKAIFNTAEYYTEKNKYNYAVSVVATADLGEK